MVFVFARERSILEYFSFSDTNEFVAKVSGKIEEVKLKLQAIVDAYCKKLEDDLRKRLEQHHYTHPREQKQLKQKLDAIIAQLESEEASLRDYAYLRPMLQILNQNRRHDIESVQKEIDVAVHQFINNMFDVTLNQDKVVQLKKDLADYVHLKPVDFQEELNYYKKLHRSGKPISQLYRVNTLREAAP